jgi:beta-glucosidase
MRIEYARGSGILAGSAADRSAAVALAKTCELAVLVVGESEPMSGEAHCRTSLDIPAPQRELMRAVHATGVPVVVVTMGGRPLSIRWAAEHAPAILQTWHLGVECGNAIADVLFGDFNPGGKLPVTVPRNVGQVPIYYNHKHTGRAADPDDPHTSKYIDVHWTPIYPFGHGLSYTDFEFSDLQVTPRKIQPDGSITVTVDVRNTGQRAGDEVVQLYIRDRVGSLTRPVKQLRGFRRITLAPGSAETVSFELGPEALGFWNRRAQYVVEPGMFKLWVGPSSAEGLEGSFEIAR